MPTTVYAFLLLCLILPASVQAALPFDESRLEATELVTNLLRPMELAVAPDLRVFYIELEGNLKVYHPESRATNLLAKIDVTTAQENGLIGLALAPDFETTQHIYLQYSPPDFPGQHISRFTLRGDKLDMQSEELLLKFTEQREECCHHSGSLEFGPSGCLFIGTGDNTHPGGDSQGYAPIDERPGRGPYDAQKSAANTHHLGGKILRIRPLADGTYEIPDGNLYPKDGSAGCPEIYVMGCRNPWRLNVDQRTGYLYWGEVGPDARHKNDRGPRGYDEVNQARAAGNFGWPYFIGNNEAYADVDFATGKIGDHYDPSKPINASPHNTGSKELPPATPAFIYYPYDKSQKFPELGDGGRTACAGPVYHFDAKLRSDRKFPEHYDNTLFIFEWSRHWIKCVQLDEDSNIKSIQPFMSNRKMQRPIDIEFGADGAMYLIEYGETWGVNQDAKIVRIDYVWGNRRPKAVAKATNNVGREPLLVTLSSEGSFDKDKDELQYEWVKIESNGDTSTRSVISREANPTIAFDKPGVFNVELSVRDTKGDAAMASVPVLVGNARPEIKLLQPKVGFFEPGKPISFDILVNDLEDGTNDYDLVFDQDLPELDGDSPVRTSLHARQISGMSPESDDEQSLPRGMQLMKGSDCFNCHDLRAKRVGPPLLEISKKYRDDGHALTKSVERVIAGSTGVWGKIPMIPHRQHTEAEVYTMVEWVYSLQDDPGLQVVRGFVGEIETSPDDSGGLELTASYTDLGVGRIPPITTSTTVKLRSRHLEAEHANTVNGPRRLEDKSASDGVFLGAINHGHSLRIIDVPTDEVGKITAHVASGGGGGTIEVRKGAQDGPLVAKFTIKASDSWTSWWDETETLTPTEGAHDLFFVFLNEDRREGLMNLDSLFFIQRSKPTLIRELVHSPLRTGGCNWPCPATIATWQKNSLN